MVEVINLITAVVPYTLPLSIIEFKFREEFRINETLVNAMNKVQVDDDFIPSLGNVCRMNLYTHIKQLTLLVRQKANSSFIPFTSIRS